jgi:hypothetical protein
MPVSLFHGFWGVIEKMLLMSNPALATGTSGKPTDIERSEHMELPSV